MISEARTALTELLTDAGFRTFDYVPPNITPPCAVVFPSGDWVAGGEVFGEYRLGFNVRIFAQALTNENATGMVDGYADTLITAIQDAPGFYLASIGAPEMYSENNSTFLGIEATIYQLTRP